MTSFIERVSQCLHRLCASSSTSEDEANIGLACHTIWLSYNSKIPDHIIENLESWRKELPADRPLVLWVNVKDIEPGYLTYLNELGVQVRDVDSIIERSPGWLKHLLEHCKKRGPDTSYLYAKLFSDIFRMVVMTGTGDAIFSGTYFDVGDTFPTEETIDQLQHIRLEHGFAFRCNARGDFDSNVSIFVPRLPSDTYPIRDAFIYYYFRRLRNWSNWDLDQQKNLTKTAITNIYNLLTTFDVSDGIAKILQTEEVELGSVNAETLLALSDDTSQPKTTYDRDIPPCDKLDFVPPSFDAESRIILGGGDILERQLTVAPGGLIPFNQPARQSRAYLGF